MYLYKNRDLFIETIEQTANFHDLPLQIVEKDYYVSLVLKELSVSIPSLVFKGGTSLSKAQNIIKRFSEDIDLSYYISSHEKPGNAKKKRLKQSITETIDKFEFTLINEENIRSRRSFNQYNIDYSAIYDTSQELNPALIIETYCFNSSFPVEKNKISNYIFEFLQETNTPSVLQNFTELTPFEMNVQSLERTFVDKLFAICDKYLFNQSLRHSRHLYDLYFIWESHRLNNDLLKKTFYETQVILQEEGDRNPSAVTGYSLKSTFEKLIEEDYFKNDYENITAVLAQEAPSYYRLKESLLAMIDRLDFLSL